jgi:A/G-specific adenine glycosylase
MHPIASRRVSRFRHRVLAWYDKRGRTFPWRRPSATSYSRIVAELLLQRTRAETVASFFPDFTARFPSWKRLASATETDLRAFLQPLGLWRRRAATLRCLASEMNRRRGRFPRTRGELEALPRVGQYVANAVLVQVHGEPAALLDGSMARVLERYFGPRELADIRYDPYLQDLAGRVVDNERSVEVSCAVLDLGAMVCKPRDPLCGSCPVQRG